MIDPQFIVNLKGKSYPIFAGVLDAATKAGLMSLKVEVVQLPTEANGMLAIVAAEAVFADGRVFRDVGDCSPKSTSANLAPACLRLASTRAKGRVLRDAVNCGQTLLEEMPDLADESHGEARPAARTALRTVSTPDQPPSIAPADASRFCQGDGCGVELTLGQIAVSQKLYKLSLCPACQAIARGKAAA